MGHVVIFEGIVVDPSKVEVVRDWPTLTTMTKIRSFNKIPNNIFPIYQKIIND